MKIYFIKICIKCQQFLYGVNIFKESRKDSFMKPNLILIAGLPATGKTTTATKLESNLENYVLIDQNEMRREAGMRKMPQNQDKILHKVDLMIASYLNNGKGVIVESGHRYLFRRQQLCGIASSCDTNVLILECICSEEESKERIRRRPVSDGLISDPNSARVYDRISKLWEPIDLDFRYPGVDYFVSHMTYNTEELSVDAKRIVKGNNNFVQEVKDILLEK